MEKNENTNLTDEEILKKQNDSLAFQFHNINKAMFRLANKRITESAVPVKMEQLPVMMTIFWLKESSQQEVADRIHRDKSSVMRTTLALEKKGLISSQKDPSDGRMKILALTDTGKFVARQIVDLLNAVEDELLSVFSKGHSKKEIINWLKKATVQIEAIANS